MPKEFNTEVAEEAENAEATENRDKTAIEKEFSERDLPQRDVSFGPPFRTRACNGNHG